MAKQPGLSPLKHWFPRGFTLIEVMVVTAIFSIVFSTTLGIVAHMNKQAQMVPIYSAVRQTADMAIQRISDAIKSSQGFFPSTETPDIIRKLACSSAGRTGTGGKNKFDFTACSDADNYPSTSAVVLKEPVIRPGAGNTTSETEEKEVYKQIAHQTSFAEVAWLDAYRRKYRLFKWNRYENKMLWRMHHNYKWQQLEQGNVSYDLQKLFDRVSLWRLYLWAHLERRVTTFHNAIRWRRFKAAVPIGGLGVSPQLNFGVELLHARQVVRYQRYIWIYRYVEENAPFLFQEDWGAVSGNYYYYNLGVKQHRINNQLQKRQALLDFQSRKLYLLKQRYMNWVVEDQYNFWTKEEHRYRQYVKQASVGETVLTERMFPVFAQSKEKRYRLQARQQLYKLQEQVRKYQLQKQTSKFSGLISSVTQGTNTFTLEDPLKTSDDIDIQKLINAGIVASNDLLIIRYNCSGSSCQEYRDTFTFTPNNNNGSDITTTGTLPTAVAKPNEVHFLTNTWTDFTGQSDSTAYGRMEMPGGGSSDPPAARAPSFSSSQQAFTNTVTSGTNGIPPLNVPDNLGGTNNLANFPLFLKTDSTNGDASYGSATQLTDNSLNPVWETNRWINHVPKLGGSSDKGLCATSDGSKISGSQENPRITANTGKTLTFPTLPNSRRVCRDDPNTPATATRTTTTTLPANINTGSATETFSFPNPNIPGDAELTAVKIKVKYEEPNGTVSKKYEAISSDATPVVYASTPPAPPASADTNFTVEWDAKAVGVDTVAKANQMKLRLTNQDAGKDWKIMAVKAVFQWKKTSVQTSATTATLTTSAANQVFTFTNPGIPSGATMLEAKVRVSYTEASGGPITRRYEVLDGTNSDTVITSIEGSSSPTIPISGSDWNLAVSGANSVDTPAKANSLKVKASNRTIGSSLTSVSVTVVFKWRVTSVKTSATTATLTTSAANQVFTFTNPGIPGGSTMLETKVRVSYTEASGGPITRRYEVLDGTSSDTVITSIEGSSSPTIPNSGSDWNLAVSGANSVDTPAKANSLKVKVSNRTMGSSLTSVAVTVFFKWREPSVKTSPETATLTTSAASQVFAFTSPNIPTTGATLDGVNVRVTYSEANGLGTVSRQYEALNSGENSIYGSTSSPPSSGADWDAKGAGVNTIDRANQMKVRLTNNSIENGWTISALSAKFDWSKSVTADSADPNAILANGGTATWTFTSPNVPSTATLTKVAVVLTYSADGAAKFRAQAIDASNIQIGTAVADDTTGDPDVVASGAEWDVLALGVDTPAEANAMKVKLTNVTTGGTQNWTITNVRAIFEWTDTVTRNTTTTLSTITTNPQNQIFTIPDPGIPGTASITAVDVKVTYSETNGPITRRYEVLDGSNASLLTESNPPSSGGVWDVKSVITSSALADAMRIKISNLSIGSTLTLGAAAVEVTFKWEDTLTQATTPATATLTPSAANEIFTIPDPSIPTGASITAVDVKVTYSETNGPITRKYEVLDGSNTSILTESNPPSSGGVWDVKSVITSSALADAMQIKISNLTIGSTLTLGASAVEVTFKWEESLTQATTPASATLTTSAANETFDIPNPSIPTGASITDVNVKVTYTETSGGPITRKYEVLNGSGAKSVQGVNAPANGAAWDVKDVITTSAQADAMQIKITNQTLGSTLTLGTGAVEVTFKWSDSNSPDTDYTPSLSTTPKTISTPTVSATFVFDTPAIQTGSTIQSVRFTTSYTADSGTTLRFEAVSSDGNTVYATTTNPATGLPWTVTTQINALTTNPTPVEAANQVRLRVTNLSSNKNAQILASPAVSAEFIWQNPNPPVTHYDFPSKRFITTIASNTSSSVSFTWDTSNDTSKLGLGKGDKYSIPRQGTFYRYVEVTGGGYPGWYDVTNVSNTVAKANSSNVQTASVTVSDVSNVSRGLALTIWRDRGPGAPDVDYLGFDINGNNYRYIRTTGNSSTAVGDIGHNDEAAESDTPAGCSDTANSNCADRWVEMSTTVPSDPKQRVQIWTTKQSSDYTWNGDANVDEATVLDFLAFGRALTDPNDSNTKFFQYLYLSANDSNAGDTGAVKVPDGSNSKAGSFRYVADKDGSNVQYTRWFTIDTNTQPSDVSTTTPITTSTRNYDKRKTTFSAFVGGQNVFVRDERDKIPGTLCVTTPTSNPTLINFSVLIGETYQLQADANGCGELTGNFNNRYIFDRNSAMVFGVPSTPGTVTKDTQPGATSGQRNFSMYEWHQHYLLSATRDNPGYADDLIGLEAIDTPNTGLPSQFTGLNGYLRRWLTTGYYVDTNTNAVLPAPVTSVTVTLGPTLPGNFVYPQTPAAGIPSTCTAPNTPTNCVDWAGKQNYMAWVTMALRSDDVYYDATKVPTFYRNKNGPGLPPVNPLTDYTSSGPYPEISGAQSYRTTQVDTNNDGTADTTFDLAHPRKPDIHFTPPVLCDVSDLTNCFTNAQSAAGFPYSGGALKGESDVYQLIQYGVDTWSLYQNQSVTWPKYIPQTSMPYATAQDPNTGVLTSTNSNVRYSYAPGRKTTDSDSVGAPTGGWTLYSGPQTTDPNNPSLVHAIPARPCANKRSNGACVNPNDDNQDNWRFLLNISKHKDDLYYTGAVVKKQIELRGAGEYLRVRADNDKFTYNNAGVYNLIYTKGANCTDTDNADGTKNVLKVLDPSNFCDLPSKVAWQNIPTNPAAGEVYSANGVNLTSPSGYPGGAAVDFTQAPFATPMIPDKMYDLPDFPQADPAASAHVPTTSGPPYSDGYIDLLGNQVANANADPGSSSMRYVVWGDSWEQTREPADPTNPGSGTPITEAAYAGNMFYPISTEYEPGYSYERLTTACTYAAGSTTPNNPPCNADTINAGSSAKTPVSSDPHYTTFRVAYNVPDQTRITQYIKFASFLDANNDGVWEVPTNANADKITVNLPNGTKNTVWFRYKLKPVQAPATNPEWTYCSITVPSATTDPCTGALNLGQTLYSKRPKTSGFKQQGDATNTIATPSPAGAPVANPTPYPYVDMPAADSSNDVKYSVNWLVRHKNLNRHYQYNAANNLRVIYTNPFWYEIGLPFDPDNAKCLSAGITAAAPPSDCEKYTVNTEAGTDPTTLDFKIPPGYIHKHKLVNYDADRTNPDQIYTATNGDLIRPDATSAWVTYQEYQDLKSAYNAINTSLATPGTTATLEDPVPGLDGSDLLQNAIRIDEDHYWLKRNEGWGAAYNGKGGIQFHGAKTDINSILDAWGDNGNSAITAGRTDPNNFNRLKPGLINGKAYLRYTLVSGVGAPTPWAGYDPRATAGVLGGGFFKNPGFGSIIGHEVSTDFGMNEYVDPDHGKGYPKTGCTTANNCYPWNLTGGQKYTFPADENDYPTAADCPDTNVYRCRYFQPVDRDRTGQLNRIPTTGGTAVGYTSWREDQYLKKPYSPNYAPTVTSTDEVNFRNTFIGTNAYAGVFYLNPDQDGWSATATVTHKRKPVDPDSGHRFIIIGQFTFEGPKHYHRPVGIGVGYRDGFSTAYFCPANPDGCQPYQNYSANADADNRILNLDRYANLTGIDNDGSNRPDSIDGGTPAGQGSLWSGVFATWTLHVAQHPAPAYHHYETNWQAVWASGCYSYWAYGYCGEFSPFNPDNATNADPNKDPNYKLQFWKGDGTPGSFDGTPGAGYIGLEQRPLQDVKHPGYESWWYSSIDFIGTSGFGWDTIDAKDHGSLFNAMRSRPGNRGFYDQTTKLYRYVDTYRDHLPLGTAYPSGLTIPAGNPGAGDFIPIDDFHTNMGGEPFPGGQGSGWHNVWGRWRPKPGGPGWGCVTGCDNSNAIYRFPAVQGDGSFPTTQNGVFAHVAADYPGNWQLEAGYPLGQSVWKYNDQNRKCKGNDSESHCYIELNAYKTARELQFGAPAFMLRETRVTALKRDATNDIADNLSFIGGLGQSDVSDDYIAADVKNIHFVEVDPPPKPQPVWKWNSIISSTTDSYKVPADDRGNPPRIYNGPTNPPDKNLCYPDNGVGNGYVAPPSQTHTDPDTGITTIVYTVALNTNLCYFNDLKQLGVRPVDVDGLPTADVSLSDFWVDEGSSYDIASEDLPVFLPRPLGSHSWVKIPSGTIVCAESATCKSNQILSPDLPKETGAQAVPHFYTDQSNTGYTGPYYGSGYSPTTRPNTIIYNWGGASGTPPGGASSTSTDENAANWIDDLGASGPNSTASKPDGGTFYRVHYAVDEGHWICVTGWWCWGGGSGYGQFTASDGLPAGFNPTGPLTKLSAVPLAIMRQNSTANNWPIFIYTPRPEEGGVVNDSGVLSNGKPAFVAQTDGVGAFFRTGSTWKADVPNAANVMALEKQRLSHRIVYDNPQWHYISQFNWDIPANSYVPYDSSTNTRIPLSDYKPGDPICAGCQYLTVVPGTVWYTNDARMDPLLQADLRSATYLYRLDEQFWKSESGLQSASVANFKTYDLANPYMPSWQQVYVINGQRTSGSTNPAVWTDYWGTTSPLRDAQMFWTGTNYGQYALIQTALNNDFTAGSASNFYEKFVPAGGYPGANPDSNISGYYQHRDSGWTTVWDQTTGRYGNLTKDNGYVNLPYLRYNAPTDPNKQSELKRTVMSINDWDTLYLARPEATVNQGDNTDYFAGWTDSSKGTAATKKYDRRLGTATTKRNKHQLHLPNIIWKGTTGFNEIWTYAHDNPNDAGLAADANYHNSYKLPGTSGTPESWQPLDGVTFDPSQPSGPGNPGPSTIAPAMSGCPPGGTINGAPCGNESLFPYEVVKLTTVGPAGANVDSDAFKANYRPKSTDDAYTRGPKGWGAGNILMRILSDSRNQIITISADTSQRDVLGVSGINKKGCEPVTTEASRNGCNYLDDDSIRAAFNPEAEVQAQDFWWDAPADLGWVRVPPAYPSAMGYSNFSYPTRKALAPQDPQDGDCSYDAGKQLCYFGEPSSGDPKPYLTGDQVRTLVAAGKWPPAVMIGSTGDWQAQMDAGRLQGLVYNWSPKPNDYDVNQLNNNALYYFTVNIDQVYSKQGDGQAFQKLPGHDRSNDPFVYVNMVNRPDKGNTKWPKAEWAYDYLAPRAPEGTRYTFEPYSEQGQEADRWIRTGVYRIGGYDAIPRVLMKERPTAAAPAGATGSVPTDVPAKDTCLPPSTVKYWVCGPLNWELDGTQRVYKQNVSSTRDISQYYRVEIIYWKQNGTDPDTGTPTGDIYQVSIDGTVPNGILSDGTALASVLDQHPEYLRDARVRKLTAGVGSGGGRGSINVSSFRLNQTPNGASYDLTAYRMIDARRPAVYRTNGTVGKRWLEGQ